VRSLPLLALAFLVPSAPAAEPFRLGDGNRVVFLGDTLVEREQLYGWWELALTTRFPGKKVSFRNLGWSGDTVFGDARAGFGTAADGFRHLKEHTLSLKPTVIFIGYGSNESFAGPAGLGRFTRGLEELLEALAPAKARIVLLSPLRQGTMPPPLPDPAAHNRDLRLYADAIRDVAKKRGHRFIDLYDRLGDVGKVRPPVTENGIHLSGRGYRWSAGELEKGLGLAPRGVEETSRAEKLRRLIVAKNELYFHRWRPQNVTYLFGFRKHEQGKNAREIPRFDPLVEAKEKEIWQLSAVK
jgi:lysophospholipase L1-like esterase